MAEEKGSKGKGEAARKKRNVVAAIKGAAAQSLSDDQMTTRRLSRGGRWGGIGITRRIADGDGHDLVIQVDDDPWDGYSRHDMDANDMIQTVDADLNDPA